METKLSDSQTAYFAIPINSFKKIYPQKISRP